MGFVDLVGNIQFGRPQVNDATADQKTFGEPNANLKTFGKSNATVKLRLAAAKCAFPRLLLVCLLLYGKNQRPAPPVIKHPLSESTVDTIFGVLES